MKIEDVMTRRVVAARADTELSHVARLMWDNDCGSVPVVDAEDKLVGMLTDRDLCMGANFSGRALRDLRAASCMASEIATCRPGDAVASVVRTMGTRRVRRMPVTDAAGRLIGLVSMGDVVGAAARAPKKEQKQIQAALIEALTAICERPPREEVASALPAGKRSDAAAKPGKGGKKRAKAQ
jgi:CBS-domain-containing membrane protein